MTKTDQLTVGTFPLILKSHPRALSLKLRYEARSGAALLTVPKGLSRKKAIQFAEKHHDWLIDQRRTAPPMITLIPDELIPFEGQNHQIIHDFARPASIAIQQDTLRVGGPRAGFEKRLENWLRKQARQKIAKSIDQLSIGPDTKPHRISIRDSKSRWGSCSSKRTLSFSWRLIMAPPAVLRYVVAHEMAHLVHMNHSKDFWRLVTQLDPQWQPARRWLKKEGSQLMLVG